MSARGGARAQKRTDDISASAVSEGAVTVGGMRQAIVTALFTVADGLSVRALEVEVAHLIQTHGMERTGRFDYELEALMLVGLVEHSAVGKLVLSEAARQLVGMTKS